MSEWRVLATGRECFEALENGDEVQVFSSGAWLYWVGDRWRSDAEYRARPKVETVTLRKALFSNDVAYECTENHARLNRHTFVCWLGEPVVYEVKK